MVVRIRSSGWITFVHLPISSLLLSAATSVVIAYEVFCCSKHRNLSAHLRIGLYDLRGSFVADIQEACWPKMIVWQHQFHRLPPLYCNIIMEQRVLPSIVCYRVGWKGQDIFNEPFIFKYTLTLADQLHLLQCRLCCCQKVPHRHRCRLVRALPAKGMNGQAPFLCFRYDTTMIGSAPNVHCMFIWWEETRNNFVININNKLPAICQIYIYIYI